MKIKKYSIFNRIEDIKDIFQEISDIGYYVSVTRSDYDHIINVSITRYNADNRLFFNLDIIIDDIRRLLDYSYTFVDHYEIKSVMNPMVAKRKFGLETSTHNWFDITRFINKDDFCDINVKVSEISINLYK